MRTPVRPARRLTSAAAALAIGTGLLALAGGSAGSTDSATAGSAAADARSEPATGEQLQGGDAAVQSDGSAAAPGKNAAVAPAVYDRKLARRADISVTVSDVDAAAAKVRVIAASAKGMVVAEAISSEPDDPALGGFSTITISVPTDQLDATLDRLAELGKVHSRNASTDDVTAQYVDTESRVKTMQASVGRVRALMSQATKLSEIVALEGELTRRQADLDALTQQLAELDQRTTMSEVTATMWTPAAATAVEGSGVVRGLNAAWEGLLDSLTLVLTGLAVLLPWLLLLALGAFIVVRVMRRRRGTAAPTSP